MILRILGGLGLLALLLVAPAQAAADEELAVRQAFEDYRNALLDRQGDIAGFLVTPETLGFYMRAAEAALQATSDDLAELPLVQQLLALRLRQAFPPDRLQAMTAEDLVGASVGEGLMDPRGLRGLSLGPVEVIGGVALAPQVDPQGREIGVIWRFRKVDDIWRIDLRPSLMAANGLLVALQRQRGLSREALLLDLVAGSIGRPVDKSLLTPPMAAE